MRAALEVYLDAIRAEGGDVQAVGDSVTKEVQQFATLSRLFSSTVFRELAKYGRSATFSRLCRSIRIDELTRAESTVGDGFNAAFEQLKQVGQRNEYVYRAAVTQKVLLGRHSLKTASMLSEFRTGDSKADLVILNGTACAYEIKSERDSLDRLATQILNYKRVFATVNVIASEVHVQRVLDSTPLDVGVMCLTRRYQIRCEREAISRPERVCPVTVFESIRSKEAQQVLKRLGIPVPDVPNTQIHREMRRLFAAQDPTAIHRETVETLKHTRNLSALGKLVDRLPSSLHAAALSTPLRTVEHKRLVGAVSVPLADALRWD